MTKDEDIEKIREMMGFLVKQEISKILKNSKERKIYYLTGAKKRNEITKLLNVSSKTLAKLWQVWEEEGLLVKNGKGYRKVI